MDNAHPWQHLVAMGDSFAEGFGDPVDGFATLGTVDHLAAALRQSAPGLRYTNLGRCGLLLAEVREQQLAPALRLRPDLVSLVAGANDILTGHFSLARWEAEFTTLFGPLAQIGAVVLAGNIPDFPLLQTMREPLRARLRGAIQRGNECIARLAAQHGAIRVDAWTLLSGYGEDDWSADGVHPNARGYFRFAQDVVAILEQRTGWTIGRVDHPPGASRPPGGPG